MSSSQLSLLFSHNSYRDSVGGKGTKQIISHAPAPHHLHVLVLEDGPASLHSTRAHALRNCLSFSNLPTCIQLQQYNDNNHKRIISKNACVVTRPTSSAS